MAPVTGVKIVIQEDGLYDVRLKVNTSFSAGGGSHFAKLTLNSTIVLTSGGQVYINAGTTPIMNISSSSFLYLKKDDVLEIYAKYDGSATGTLPATSTSAYANYIEAVNLTKLARGGM